jgi:hypothetical protein
MSNRDPSRTDAPTTPTGTKNQLPAEKAMKQTSKTAAERNEPEGPNDGPMLSNEHNQTRTGDAAPSPKGAEPDKAP